jgi:hypothetical protein
MVISRPKRPQQGGVRLSDELIAKLAYVKQREGIPYSEQVRRALQLYFDQKDVPNVTGAARRRRKKVARG